MKVLVEHDVEAQNLEHPTIYGGRDLGAQILLSHEMDVRSHGLEYGGHCGVDLIP